MFSLADAGARWEDRTLARPNCGGVPFSGGIWNCCIWDDAHARWNICVIGDADAVRSWVWASRDRGIYYVECSIIKASLAVERVPRITSPLDYLRNLITERALQTR
jgi:hypothetical protein